MFSSAQTSTEFKVWKNWKHDHPEFEREDHSIVLFEGKILLIGGYSSDQRVLSVVLLDPESQKYQVLSSVGDVQSCSFGAMGACYWKDSKIIVYGGYDYDEDVSCTRVAVVTLKDLDSDNPSAHWEKIAITNEFSRCNSSAYIYKEKMYAFGGLSKSATYLHDVWCLDLNDFTWSQCEFPGFTPEEDGIPENTIFHENKAYAIQKRPVSNLEGIKEFDLETMSFQWHPIPKCPIDYPLMLQACSQVIDEKIYLLEDKSKRPKDGPIIKRQVLAIDLDSKEWIEVKTESFSYGFKIGFAVSCHNLIVCAPLVDAYHDKDTRYGEFWSLSLK